MTMDDPRTEIECCFLRGRAVDALGVGAILAAVVIFFWEPIFTGRVLLLRDLHGLYQPWLAFSAQAIRAGVLPLWNHYSCCGMPFLAYPQMGVFYPPNVVFYLLPFAAALHAHIIGHTLLLGLGGYGLMRSFRFGPVAGVVTALVMMFAGWPLRAQEFLGVYASICWYPVVILCWWRLCSAPTGSKAALAGVVLALQTLAGYPQTQVYLLIIAAAIWLLHLRDSDKKMKLDATASSPAVHMPQDTAGQASRATQNEVSQSDALSPSVRGRAPRLALRRILLPALALAIVAGLTAAQMLPTAELWANGQREQQTMSPAEAAKMALRPGELVSLVFPYFFGYPDWYVALYVGLPTLLVAPWSLLWCVRANSEDRQRRRLILLSIIVAALGLALAMNWPFSLSNLLSRLFPGWQDVMRWQSLGITMSLFLMSVLAGAGVDALMRRAASPQSLRSKIDRYCLAATALVTAFFAGFVLIDLATGFRMGHYAAAQWHGRLMPTYNHFLLLSRYPLLGQYALALIWTVPALVLIVLRWRGRLGAGSFGIALAALLAVNLFVFGYKQNYYSPTNVYEMEPPIVSELRGEGAPGRITFAPGGRPANDYAYASRDDSAFLYVRSGCVDECTLPYHVFKSCGWSSMQPRAWAQLNGLMETFAARPDVVDRLMLLFGVGSVLRPTRQWRRIDEPPPFERVPRPDVLPRVFAVPRTVTATGKDAMRIILLGEEDPRKLAVIDREPAVPVSSGVAEIESIAYDVNSIRIVLADAAPGYVVDLDTFYPGWRAFVERREAPIARAFTAFRAFPVGGGRQTVVLAYEPAAFVVGCWLSASAAAGVALGMLCVWTKRFCQEYVGM